MPCALSNIQSNFMLSKVRITRQNLSETTFLLNFRYVLSRKAEKHEKDYRKISDENRGELNPKSFIIIHKNKDLSNNRSIFFYEKIMRNRLTSSLII